MSPTHDDGDTRQPLLAETETGPRTSSHLEKSACDRKERLRRFLSFCMAIDYGITSETPDQLTNEDFCFFVDLGRRCFLRRGQDRPLLKADGLGYLYLTPVDITVDDPVVQNGLMQPSMELGVPCSAVVVTLRLFLRSINFWRTGYTSQIEWVACKTGMDNLAARFWMERWVVLSALYKQAHTTQTFCDFLCDRILKVQRLYFSQIRSPQEYYFTPRGSRLRMNEVFCLDDERMAGQKLLDEEGGPGTVKDLRRASLMADRFSPAMESDPLSLKLVRFWTKTRDGRRYDSVV
ncbi:unnamed protein product [Zymoseptoria tritici ST99CH_3D7]|uniref:Uncharacterized protein n=1 Tax=Zymoseptoria tritici (strain ST99CH_3D7) TaxID=1276538 RepID=A0A1X7RZ63_ZYMT9|nr:unnamed protein product [Zymoseptoria tritici ST99CH_3D7]